MEKTPCILVVNSDVSLLTLIANALKKENCQVEKITHDQEALNRIMASHFDLVILDTDMGSLCAADILRTMREANRTTPVVILSARSAEEDILAGYTAGCDAYVTKPFSMDILMAVVQAILRRMSLHDEQQQTQYQVGHLLFDTVHQKLGDAKLSSRESELLHLLCRHKAQLVERSLILKALWSTDDFFASRSLSVYINHLRAHLRQDPSIQIMAVHGRGYKLVENN